MSQVKRHLKLGISLFIAGLFALNCARSGQTQFSKNLENDKGKAAPTYEEWVALVGQDKTDQLYAGIGQDSLNLLSYAIGWSNMVDLITKITSTPNLVALIGNDSNAGTGVGGSTGLGVPATLYLIQRVDVHMQANISVNLTTGAAVPTSNDTTGKLASVVNNFALVSTLQAKLIDLMGTPGFNLPRALNTVPAQTTVDKLAKIIAHVDSGSPTATKLNNVINGLVASDITGPTGKMVSLINGVTSADKLVEVMATSTASDLVTILQSPTGVTYANVGAKMVLIINAVGDCSKMGYLVTQVGLAGNLPKLINMINNVQVPGNMGQLLNMAEDSSTWASQVSPAETWGTGPGGQASKAAPYSMAGSGSNRTYTGATVPVGAVTLGGASGGSNYLPGATATIATCTVQPTLHLNIVGGVIQTTGHYATTAGSGCGGGANLLTIVTPATSKTTMARLVDIINGLTAAQYYKLLNLVDGLDTTNGMTKMVRLVQDLANADDVFDLMNNMSGVAGTAGTCTVANGTDTVTITGGGGTLATAVSFNVGGQIAYIRMTANGSGYTSQPTISVPGCAAVTYTAVGPTSGGAPISMISVNNPVNNLVQVVQQLTLANVPRLQQVMDGQRIFDNTGTQPNAALTTTYLGKLNVLMQNLSQPLEGPLKVGDLLAGVTNTDKIIDLIWGVTTTTNLSTVINGIFKASEVPGCSDGSAGTFAGPSTTSASDTGTCENSGNGFIYGERDTAVTTLVYLVENVASAAKLIAMIDNITPANVIALVNHTATYSQHADHPTPGSTYHVYPRGASNLDAQAAGKKLAKIVDNTTTIGQLIYVTNNVSSMIKMSKLVAFMDIGVSAITGTGKMATLINAIGGTNCYLSTTVPGRGNTTAAAPGGSAACVTQNSQNATGMGKMVNVVDFINGSTVSNAMVQLKNLLNDVTDINKTADLINQTVNSSNIVGLLNGVTDVRYGTSTTDLVNMLNLLPRGEISKMVSLVGEIGNATGTATQTFPGQDHVLIAQLMSNYVAANIATTSGIGQARMNQLIGNLSMSGGQNYTTSPAINLTGLGTYTTVGAATPIVSPATGTVTKVTLTVEGSCTTAPTGATISGGAGSGAAVTVISAPVANTTNLFKVKSVFINDGGSGYTAPTLAFTGGAGCGTAPVATVQIGGVIGATVTSGGVGYTDSFAIPAGNITGGAGTGATATGLVAGPINTLTGFYGGAGYVATQVCPIQGAGGSGGTCTVNVTSGAVTGCSAIGAGSGYIDGQIVTIGGAAVIRANVTAGSITGYTVVSGGCGYSGSPTVVVTTGAGDCTAPPAAGTATVASGVITGVTGGTGGGGTCTANPRVTVGESPYATHGDGATAIVANVTGGSLVAVSFSAPSDMLAQLLTNTEKGPGNAAINYNGTTTPNISAREAMVRMLHHGVNHTSAGYASSPAVYPGVGPVHIAQNVLNNLSAAGSTMAVINLMNSDSTSLTDLVVMIGCGDHVEYANGNTAPLSDNDFHFFCSSHTPTLW